MTETMSFMWRQNGTEARGTSERIKLRCSTYFGDIQVIRPPSVQVEEPADPSPGQQSLVVVDVSKAADQYSRMGSSF